MSLLLCGESSQRFRCQTWRLRDGSVVIEDGTLVAEEVRMSVAVVQSEAWEVCVSGPDQCWNSWITS